jgi:tellurite methyltransferase
MLTTIIGFHQDDAGDWVAELACGHGQHMRHRPPWAERPWVALDEERAARLGLAIDCPLCDRIEMPPAAAEYRRTATFSEQTLPDALRRDHRTKPGTWARIVVESGELDYHVRGRVQRLDPGRAGLVEPEIPHRVEPVGAVRVHVEFFRVPV